ALCGDDLVPALAATGPLTLNLVSDVETLDCPTCVTTTDIDPLTFKTCMMVVGADNGAAALVNADLGPQGRQCFIPIDATIVEVTVSARSGTPHRRPDTNDATET